MRRPVLLLLPVLLLAACSSGAAKPVASGMPDLRTLAKDPSHDHVTKAVTYPQTPPMGGPHWKPGAFGAVGWLSCGVYTAPVPDVFAVHSEEHGAVWLTYRPGAPASDVAALTALRQRNPAYVMVSPYPGQPTAVAASTWGAQLSVASSGDPQLARFVDTYAGGGQGGEKGAPCTPGDSPAEAEAALRRAGGGTVTATTPPANAAARSTGVAAVS
ncbi:MAG: uncharacterized protein JWN17_2949 [Frankiales bacterium]|nr:uncharacterized protein [Frankiales bacterium]